MNAMLSTSSTPGVLVMKITDTTHMWQVGTGMLQTCKKWGGGRGGGGVCPMLAHRNVQEASNPSLYGRRCRLQVSLPAAMHHAQGCNWSMLSCRVRHVDHITSNVHALCCYTLTCTLAQLRVGNAHTQAAHDCCQTRCHSTVTLHRTTIMRFHIACLSVGCQRCAAHSGSTNHRAVHLPCFAI